MSTAVIEKAARSYRILYESRKVTVIEVPPSFRMVRTHGGELTPYYFPWTYFAVRQNQIGLARPTVLYVKQSLAPVKNLADQVFEARISHYSRDKKLGEFCLHYDHDKTVPKQLKKATPIEVVDYVFNSTFFSLHKEYKDFDSAKRGVVKSITSDKFGMSFGVWVDSLGGKADRINWSHEPYEVPFAISPASLTPHVRRRTWKQWFLSWFRK